jgi:hypothetical protein
VSTKLQQQKFPDYTGKQVIFWEKFGLRNENIAALKSFQRKQCHFERSRRATAMEAKAMCLNASFN